MKRKLSSFILLFALFLSSCNNGDSNFVPVKRVVDGDTFYVEDGTKKGLDIRLIGVDAPESRRSAHKEVGYYGKEAKNYLKNLLTGKRVRLEYDIGRTDKYGRTLAYVYLEDGTFLNALLVQEGYAQVLTIPPNVKYADKFVELQRDAREHNRGLWGTGGTPIDDNTERAEE